MRGARLTSLALACVLGAALAGCASEPANELTAYPAEMISVASNRATGQSTNQTSPKSSAGTERGAEGMDAAADLAASGLPFVRSQPESAPPFPLVLNEAVKRYVKAYADNSAGLRQCFQRSQPYLPAMVNVFKREGLPPNLVYLSFAESQFKSGGAGPWQLSRATARRFHLIVNRYVDERRDPIKSTRAAAQYLATLHNEAGNWQLALVGWNRGEKALDHYWSLRGVSYGQLAAQLPYNTRSLLDRFMAVAIIAQQPTEYGFDPVNYSKPERFLTIKVKGGTSLKQVAHRTGISLVELKRLNPALVHGVVPRRMRSYDVRLPLLENAALQPGPDFCPRERLWPAPACGASAGNASLLADSNRAATRVF